MVASFSNWIKSLNIHLPWVLVIFLISIQSHISGDHMGSAMVYSDKIVHFAIFGLLAWLLARAVFKEENRFLHHNYFWVILIFIAIFAIIDEIHQFFIPGRYFELMDWLADVSGACMFLFIYKKRNGL